MAWIELSENAPLADLQGYEQIELPSPRLTQILANWQPDVLIHCAGRASVPAAMQDPHADYIDGPALTFEILEALRQIYLSAGLSCFPARRYMETHRTCLLLKMRRSNPFPLMAITNGRVK